jgi:hypothetical protein
MTNIQPSTAGQLLRAFTNSIKVLPNTRTQVDLGVITVFDSGYHSSLNLGFHPRSGWTQTLQK